MRTLDVGAAIDARPFGGFQWMVVALCGVLLIVDGYDVFVAGTVLPLDQAVEGYDLLRRRQAVGKVILTMTGASDQP